MEPPRYFWKKTESVGADEWYYVKMKIPKHESRLAWIGWVIMFDRQSPWEGAQSVALCAQRDIYQKFGEELGDGTAATFPRVDPARAEWNQVPRNALVQGRGERVENSNAAMNAMMAVLKLYQSRKENDRELQETQYEVNQLMGIVDTSKQQFVWAVRERDRNHDQMMALTHGQEAL
jgi:hypothetical protein